MFTPGRLIFAEPSNETPPMFLAVARVVAVSAFPVTSPVRFAVTAVNCGLASVDRSWLITESASMLRAPPTVIVFVAFTSSVRTAFAAVPAPLSVQSPVPSVLKKPVAEPFSSISRPVAVPLPALPPSLRVISLSEMSVFVVETVVVVPLTVRFPATVSAPSKATALSDDMVTAVARLLAELPEEPPAGATCRTMEPPAPVPVPWPPASVRFFPAVSVPVTAVDEIKLLAEFENFKAERTAPPVIMSFVAAAVSRLLSLSEKESPEANRVLPETMFN